MKTPAGVDCKYFYANYYRGRNQQACRLVEGQTNSERWTPGLCRDCPVPRLLRANACRHLILEGRVVKTWGGLGRKMAVSATCTKTLADVPHPETGCGHCHESINKLVQP
jgi:hypothetical protein